MAVASANTEKIEQPPSESTTIMDQSPPTAVSVSDVASQTSSAGDPSDHSFCDLPNSSATSSPQHPPSLRSEEYRQLFRLPHEEVLIQDFNCALQENFLLQGHMYLFVHYICFYSNLFGFENKKIIHFQEITSLRRAKTAAIFPTAIEINTAERKYFFTSFLSRDEAFKLIEDGWMQHGNGAKAIPDQQESRSEFNSQESGSGIFDEAKNSKQPVDELDFTEWNKNVSVAEDSEPLLNSEAEIVLTSSAVQDNLEEDAQVVQVTDCSSSGTSLEWKLEDSDAPEVPGYYTMVAESKFPIKVEEFFKLFFSDDAIDFVELCHKKCGDKDFRCSSWYQHDEFGHARDVSFQHPIKIYFGKRFGCCQEIQKYRVYKNSHLVVHTSQEISDVPYADYFRVEGLWDVRRGGDESKECCNLRVYVNVSFSKYTMFKGKIMQSTVEECGEAYAIWIDLTHKLLRQKNLEKEEGIQAANLITNSQDPPEGQSELAEHSEKSNGESDFRLETLPDSKDTNQASVPSQGSLSCAASVASFFRDSVGKFCLPSRSQSQLPSLAVIVVAVIFLLMQITIIILLARPQQIHVVPQADYYGGSTTSGGGETAGMATLLGKQISHLKEEMVIVETLLEKMHHEHSLLKDKLKDLTLLRKKHIS